MADIHWGASHRVIISCAADRLTIAVLPVLAALTFGYSTYLSVETENDPVGGAFSLAVYSVFLLSTVSIIYAQSLRDEWSRERRKIGLCVVISLYCIIGMPFARVSAALPQNVKAKDYHRCTTTFEELDKSGEYSNAEFDYSEVLASQVRQLAMDICQLASARQINVVNGDSGQMGNVASFLVPAAALGALGYGYMKWKGLSFSDFMYVIKCNMANDVTSMTKHLEQVSAALAATERHLTQMIGNLDGKLVELKERIESLKNEINEVGRCTRKIRMELEVLQKMVCGLDGKIDALEDKQNFCIAGVTFLCQFVGGTKDGKRPEFLQVISQNMQGQTETPKRLLRFLDTPRAKGLQCIAEGADERTDTGAVFQNGTEGLVNTKSLTGCCTELLFFSCFCYFSANLYYETA